MNKGYFMKFEKEYFFFDLSDDNLENFVLGFEYYKKNFKKGNHLETSACFLNENRPIVFSHYIDAQPFKNEFWCFFEMMNNLLMGYISQTEVNLILNRMNYKLTKPKSGYLFYKHKDEKISPVLIENHADSSKVDFSDRFDLQIENSTEYSLTFSPRFKWQNHQVVIEEMTYSISVEDNKETFFNILKEFKNKLIIHLSELEKLNSIENKIFYLISINGKNNIETQV